MRKYVFALILSFITVLQGQSAYAQIVDDTVNELNIIDNKEIGAYEQLNDYKSQNVDENNASKSKITKQRRCGMNCTYEFDNHGVITIRPIDSSKEANIREGAFAERKDFTIVRIAEGIVSIGDKAFYDTNLAEIDFPSTLTFIGESAFSETSLKKINMDKKLSSQTVDKGILTNGKLMEIITPEQLKDFIAKGADVNAEDIGGETPLMSAAYNSLEVAEILLKHGANVEKRNWKEWSPLTYAVFANNPQMVELLLKHGADINAQSNDGTTSLMSISIGFLCSGDPKKVEMLIRYGADVNIKDNDGRTALMRVARNDCSLYSENQQIVEVLLKHSADINAQDKNGATALMHACEKNPDLAVIQTLLDNGAKVQNAKLLIDLLAKNIKIKKNHAYWDLIDRLSNEIDE